MSEHQGAERRSSHNSCLAHEGLVAKLNVNLLFGSIGLLLLSTLLALVIDTNASVKIAAQHVARLERELDGQQARIVAIEQLLQRKNL